METVRKTIDEFITYFEQQLRTLIPHDFISHQQSKYFAERKENLKMNEMLIVCDFSENYSFLIQSAIQSFHWSNKQCTIHPFALYWKEGDELKMQSIIFIAESTKHNITAVYQFQVLLLEWIKEKQDYGNITDIIFFSDGAGGQYKNKKNLFNIAQYKERFGYNVEWHCFATSHGKSACDGIGGTFKRNAKRASLQQDEKPIRTAKELFDWANEKKDSKVIFFFCTNDEYETTEKELATRYVNVKTIKGTQSYHSFKPMSQAEYIVRRFSASEVFKRVTILQEE